MKTQSVIILVGGLLIAGGCGQPSAQEKKQEPSQSKSTIQTAVEGMTGKTAVDAGKKAQQQIRDVSEKANQSLNEVIE